MPAKTIETTHMTAESHKSAFFRQSGWMMVATVVGGVFMSLVHIFSKFLPKEEYSALGTLIQLLNWITIPALGLQMVFAQQASAASTELQKRQLVGTARAVMKWTFCLWLIMAITCVVKKSQIIDTLQLSNPASLWLTIVVGFVMLWLPLFQGLLQGRQNFMWLGWVAILNGVGRVLIAAVIVLLLHGWAAGVMAGVLIGLVVALSVATWQNADLWSEPSAAFDTRGWLKRVVPLTLGFGASQFLFSADMIVVQTYLGGGDQGLAAPYVFGGTLAKAIVLFTGPLAAVMFPKLVQSAARSQKSNLMGLTLVGTAVLCCMAAVGLTLTAPILVKFGSKPEYAPQIVPLMALFSWSMVPLAVGNVLLNNLMAHSRFKIVPVLAVLAVGYWVALQHYHESFKMVIQTLGVFTLLFMAVCAVFTWGPLAKEKVKAGQEL